MHACDKIAKGEASGFGHVWNSRYTGTALFVRGICIGILLLAIKRCCSLLKTLPACMILELLNDGFGAYREFVSGLYRVHMVCISLYGVYIGVMGFL